MSKKRVIVIGAGPGGLTAAMLLASKGYQVDVFEKQAQVGGRNGKLVLDGGFTFDFGPTFLMMPFVLEEVFELAGRSVHDYLELKRIDPLYRLVFSGNGKTFLPTQNPEAMREQLNRLFPGNDRGFLRS